MNAFHLTIIIIAIGVMVIACLSDLTN